MMSLRELIGIEVPIIQAPMAGSQASALTIAVASAGGLGSLPCALLGLEDLRSEIEAIAAATSLPFNLNFFCHTEPAVDEAREAAWRRLLAPYIDEYRLDSAAQLAAVRRNPFSKTVADAIEPYRPPIVSFHFGLPPASLLQRIKSWGTKIMASATTVTEARWLEAHGVDAIIAQGLEAGGHRGHFLSENLDSQMGTFALLPQICAAVTVPVIAAGGIADANGVAAVLSMGAAAAQVGTAYLLCPEASTSAVHRAALRSDVRGHTALTNLFSGRPARGIVNRLMRDLGSNNPAAPAFPLASNALAPLRAAAESQGSGDFSPLWCGQNASGCREVSAAALTRALAGQ